MKEILAEQSKNITANSVDLLEVKINRDSTSGLTIYMKSSEPFMRQFGYQEKDGYDPIKIGGIYCSFPKNEQLKNIRGWFCKDNFFEYDNEPNMTLLLAEDLDKGVTFNFGSAPISESRVYEWLEKLKMQVKTLYLTYCKPVDVRVIFNTQTIEKESHD